MRHSILLLGLLAAPLAAAPPRRPRLPSGPAIASITIETHNVFDTDSPPENKLLYRLANRAQVVGLLQSRLEAWPATEVLARLQAVEIPCGPINSVADSLADAHYQARGNIVEMEHATAGHLRSLANPVRLADTPAAYRLPPPRLGEHTPAILAELGYAAGQIEALRAAGDISFGLP